MNTPHRFHTIQRNLFYIAVAFLVLGLAFPSSSGQGTDQGTGDTLDDRSAEPPTQRTASSDTLGGRFAESRAPAESGALSESGAPSESGALSESGAPFNHWREFDRLVSEQKYQSALDRIPALREAAREAGDDSTWARALIEELKLRLALHEHENAIQFLREQPWPEDPIARAALGLHYANALVDYWDAYGWEIRKRERVAADTEGDLQTWTFEQLTGELHEAYARIWTERQRWGRQPVGALSPYVEPNNYPPRIRGTMRDAISYFWVKLLSGQALWSPKHSNELYKVDLPELIGNQADSVNVDLTHSDVHPLVKICAILHDLELWHARHGRIEAALEARLERLGELHRALSRQDDDRIAIRQDLESMLERFDPNLEWWSMGQFRLAQFLRQESSPNALIRAREAAQAGWARHPESIGGVRCAAEIEEIESPSYSLQAMASDGLAERSIQVTHRNVDRLYFRAWRYDLEERLRTRQAADRRERSRIQDPLLGRSEVDTLIRSEEPDAAWDVVLPATPDYRSHITYVTPEISKPGAYLVAASRRSDFARETGNEIVAVNILLTDLVLSTQWLEDAWEVSARSGSSGDPLPGVDLTLHCFRCDRDLDQDVWQTGEDGIARLEWSSLEKRPHLLFGRLEQDIAFLERLSPGYRDPPEETTSGFLYTDRSIYRPGQIVHWKLVAYSGQESQYRTLPHRETVVQLLDSNRETVATDTVETNEFGSTSGEFVIPEGRLLGQWIVDSALGGRRVIEVAEYKRPTFEVSIEDPQTPLRLNRPAAMAGSARYYFGQPVTNGKVEWRVSRVSNYPRGWRWRDAGSQIVASGSAILDREGRFVVAFTPEADEREAATEGLTYRYALKIDVTDDGGETRSANRAFGLGFVAVSARIQAETGFFMEGESGHLTVNRADLIGVPRPGSGKWRLTTLRQPERTVLPADEPVWTPPGQEEGYQTAGDRLRPRWNVEVDPEPILAQWSEGETLAAGELEHGDDGSATIDLPVLAAGAYRVLYETEDQFGETFRTHHELVVAGREHTPLSLPLVLLAERPTISVGEVARVFVHSGLEDQELVLELYRDERIDRQVLDSNANGRLIEIPITAADRGGIGIALSAVRDHQLMEIEQIIFVPWEDRELTVEFTTFRDRVRPGTRETFRVTVRGGDQHPVEASRAELLAYMYDRSLDAFAPHSPPNPLSLYPHRYGVGGRSSSLGVERSVFRWSPGLSWQPPYPLLADDELQAIDGYGVGGPGIRRTHTSHSGDSLMMLSDAAMPHVRGGRVGEITVMALSAPNTTPESAVSPTSPLVEIRSDFSETAFFLPHVKTDEDGAAAIEFEVPDAVTEWNVWVHALTSDLAFGAARRTTASVKELMVRPSLPRFLREGDRVVLPVLINNASTEALTGTLELSILDPETEEDRGNEFDLAAFTGTVTDPTSEAREQQVSSSSAVSQPFTVEPGSTADLSFVIQVPPGVGSAAVRVVARAGSFSDGELHVLPVLPGRLHLAQSRFAALKDSARRELRFEDLSEATDSTLVHDQLVVTVDAQLFQGVIQALPYLVDYPYESSEQLVNRFLGSGIVASLYDQYPAIARTAEQFSTRETELAPWDATDPNQKVALEEAPWLAQARGSRSKPANRSLSDPSRDENSPPDVRLIRLLDPRVARATRAEAIAKLRNLQSEDGGFPWRSGGWPSIHMTLYVLSGLSKALEFGIDVPKPMITQAWAYLYRHYLEKLTDSVTNEAATSVASSGAGNWETITFLNYVLSSYPDESWTAGLFTAEDRRRMLEYSFTHWREHSPLLKGYLALTLARADRASDAGLVFDSVLDSARSDEDLGTYWAPEDRAWLWYNDTIETHAFALRVLMELQPDDPRRHGLVHWLYLNKKLDHWKSTRATAEVMYALAHYLQREGTLMSREEMRVTAGPLTETFDFDPDEYTGGRNRLVVPGEEIDPAMGSVVVEKSTPGFAFASATWHFSTERLPEESPADLFAVTRSYFRRSNVENEWILRPLEDGEAIQRGDQLEVHLSIRARHAAEYVHLRDPRPAGFEPESATSGHRRELGLTYYEEIRDSGANFFFEWLPAGEYTLKYRVRASLAGSFRAGPAALQSLYAPEFVSYSAGQQLEIEPPAK